MKSSKEDLKRRGFVKGVSVEYNDLTTEQLYDVLNSEVAQERTSAVITLRKSCSYSDKTYINLLLDMLSREKALYTKMEICKTLEGGNSDTVRMMCDYLGKIGNNQHKAPDDVSRKKSYPLARDIIARSLGRMDMSVFPVLLEQLKERDREQVSELIDAIGYMVFYNPDLANESNFDRIKETYTRFAGDELIIWKIARCCSAFPIEKSVEALDDIVSNTTENKVILGEVKKSLGFLI